MKVGKNRIRLLYYSGTLSIMLVLLAFLGGAYLFSYTAQTREKIKQLADGIYSTKKEYAKDAVERTLQDIDIERNRLIDSERARLGRVWDRIDAILAEEPDTAGFLAQVRDGKIVSTGIDALCFERRSGRVFSLTAWTVPMAGISNLAAFHELGNNYPLTLFAENDRFAILLGFSGDYIETEVQENSKYRIRSMRLADDGYIWVNKIVNYSGGDNYAIRLVHPNLADTEDSFLSTETLDIQGNKPYLAELEGVIKDGELYNDYWFKKMDSDVTAHKLSFAKLYKPYDWVIGTGVYLDDLDALIERETEVMRQTQRNYLFRFIALGGFSCFLAIALIIIFEHRLEFLIRTLQSEVTEKNRQLEAEKKRIEEIAYLDPLTGLMNRRAMLAAIEQASARVLRREGTFAIALADIDYFKKVNDECGHLAGDQMLIALSAALKSRLRGEDSLSRWGGEEFLFLLHNAGEAEAVTGVERLRETVEATEVSCEGRTIRVTMSFGVASWTEETASVNELIRRADIRLYEAKERGRNQVVGKG